MATSTRRRTRAKDQDISEKRHFTGTSERHLLESTIWLVWPAAEDVGEVHALLELDRAVRLEAPDAAVREAEVERGAPLGRVHGDGVVQVEAHREGEVARRRLAVEAVHAFKQPAVARRAADCARARRRSGAT